MLIQRVDEELKRFIFVGTGRVLAKDGQNPLTRTVANGTTRIGFGVLTGSTINKKMERTYQTIPCAVYSNNWSKNLYNIALTLKKNDIVFIAGYKHEGVYTDQATGEQKKSVEYRLEYLLPLKVFAKYIKEVDEETIPMRERIIQIDDDDGCSF